MSETTEKLTGQAKEVAGDVLGKDDLKTEGEQQQKKAEKKEEAEELKEEARAKEIQAQGHAGAEKSAD